MERIHFGMARRFAIPVRECLQFRKGGKMRRRCRAMGLDQAEYRISAGCYGWD
jgi:hypothetical protein